MAEIFIVRNLGELEDYEEFTQYYDAAHNARNRTHQSSMQAGIWHATPKRKTLIDIWVKGEMFQVQEWVKYAGQNR